MAYSQVEWSKLWAKGKTEMNRYHLNAMEPSLKSKSDINVCQKNASGKDANQHSHITYSMCSMQITLNCQNHTICLHIISKIDFRSDHSNRIYVNHSTVTNQQIGHRIELIKYTVNMKLFQSIIERVEWIRIIHNNRIWLSKESRIYQMASSVILELWILSFKSNKSNEIPKIRFIKKSILK